MSLLENLVGVGVPATFATVGAKWLWDQWRDGAARRRGDAVESLALTNMREEVGRLSAQVQELRVALSERDEAVRAMTAAFETHVATLHEQIDRERDLRRQAEDALSALRRQCGLPDTGARRQESKP